MESLVTDINEQLFTPFEGYDTKEFRFKIVPLSDSNVRKIMTVATQFVGIPQDKRIEFARIAGLSPEIVEVDGKKQEKWEFQQKYTQQTFYAALAQAMFLGFPKIVEVNGSNNFEILDAEKKDALNRKVVLNAFFLLKQECDFTTKLAESSFQHFLTNLSSSMNQKSQATSAKL